MFPRPRLSCLALPVLLLLPLAVRAAETSWVKAGLLNIVAETEGPYIESGDDVFALPSAETAVELSLKDWDRLVALLRANCAKKSGCELLVEAETKAVIGLKTQDGTTFTPALTAKQKKTYPGQARKLSTVLVGWMWDTFTLRAETRDGIFCIPNDYAYSDYQRRASVVLQALGEQQQPLNKPVVLTVHTFEKSDEADPDCAAFLADVEPAP